MANFHQLDTALNKFGYHQSTDSFVFEYGRSVVYTSVEGGVVARIFEYVVDTHDKRAYHHCDD